MAIRSSVNYGGAKVGMLATIRKNEFYIHNLKRYLYGIPKKAVGVVAATVLERAMAHTVKDSVRAAANWNLVIGSSPPPSEWSPKAYKEHPIGDRGEGGLAYPAVQKYKFGYYGIEYEGKFVVPKIGGKLHTDLRVGQGGGVPQVHIYNPIFTAQSFYAKNAWGDQAMDGSLLTGVVLDQVTSDFMPKYIHELAMRLKTSASYKEF